MDVVRMRVGHLLRRGWRATLFLAVLAGLAGGVAMAAFSIGRRASTVFDRFLVYSDPSELLVNFCPPELEEIDEESLRLCFVYDAVDEVAIANQLPEVEAAGRAAYVGLTAALAEQPDRTTPANALVSIDDELLAVEGRPIVLAGRRPGPAATDEIAINERLAEQLGANVGSELELTLWSNDEMGMTAAPGETFNGPRLRVRVVGIERDFRDLFAGVGSTDSAIDEARVLAGPGLARSFMDAGRFGGVAIDATDDDIAAASAAVDEAFAGRLFNVSPLADADETEPLYEAIRYEAAGTMLFGAITALAAAAFAAQTVSRQSRREWSDGPSLRAIGMSDRDAAAASVVRGAITGAIAAGVAVAASIAFAALGPFGVGGQIEIDESIVIDGPVLAVGAVLLLLVVTSATWWPVARQFRRSPGAESTSRRNGWRTVQGHLPAPATAGLSMSVSGHGAGGLPTGTALAGVALAFTTALAAVGLSASLDTLIHTPSYFGAPWDVSVSASFTDPTEATRILSWVRADARVEAAAGLVGTDAGVGDETAWVQSFEPVDGIDASIGPVITDGRAPAAVNEIALGAVTMVDQGLAIGGTVDVRAASSSAEVIPMVVVGATIVNDTSENNPGRGGVVTTEWMDQYAPESSANPLVVRLAPGADADQFQADVSELASGFVESPLRQGAIRNVERIRFLPYLLAALVGVLAVASLAHALVLSVRRQRSQLAILKSLGFRRGQVRAAVAWHASALVLAAAVVGVPLGVIVGRWGWRLVADELGVASPPTTPLLWLAVVVIGVVAVANLVAAYPAWRAAREPTARALRVE